MTLPPWARRGLLAAVGLACIMGALAGAAGVGFYLGLFSSVENSGRAERFARRVRSVMLHRLGSIPVRLEAGQPPASSEWPLYGGDAHNSRFSPLDQIRVGNVDRLRVAWVHQSTSTFGRQVSVPVMHNGYLFYTQPPGSVIAVDAATGEEYWRYEHRVGTLPPVCCGVKNRGAAVLGDLVYVATIDDQLIALDRREGAIRWKTTVADPAAGYSITMAPQAADGRVIVGASGGEFGVRGFVDAYDAATGNRLWRFWTVPSPEEGGWWGRWSARTLEGDSLPRDLAAERADSARYADAWQRGGGAVWMTPAYDAKLGLVYVGTGNPAPALDGRVRPGDNLYTVSIVALDAATGQLRWYRQLIPHDLGDHDAATPLVLFEATVGDSLVPALAHASKTGWVYVLDRRTGTRILRSEAFVPQNNPLGVPTTEGTITYPSASGGAQWMPPAYSPRRGLLYVLGRHWPSRSRLTATAHEHKPGQPYEGGEIERLPLARRGTGDRLSAVSLTTGEVVWQRIEPRSLGASGALATAGDLVFVGEGTKLRGFHAGTGALLWVFELGAKVLGAPVSYAVGRRQYVAVAASNAVFAFALDAAPTQPEPAGTPPPAEVLTAPAGAP